MEPTLLGAQRGQGGEEAEARPRKGPSDDDELGKQLWRFCTTTFKGYPNLAKLLVPYMRQVKMVRDTFLPDDPAAPEKIIFGGIDVTLPLEALAANVLAGVVSENKWFSNIDAQPGIKGWLENADFEAKGKGGFRPLPNIILRCLLVQSVLDEIAKNAWLPKDADEWRKQIKNLIKVDSKGRTSWIIPASMVDASNNLPMQMMLLIVWHFTKKDKFWDDVVKAVNNSFSKELAETFLAFTVSDIQIDIASLASLSTKSLMDAARDVFADAVNAHCNHETTVDDTDWVAQYERRGMQTVFVNYTRDWDILNGKQVRQWVEGQKDYTLKHVSIKKWKNEAYYHRTQLRPDNLGPHPKQKSIAPPGFTPRMLHLRGGKAAESYELLVQPRGVTITSSEARQKCMRDHQLAHWCQVPDFIGEGHAVQARYTSDGHLYARFEEPPLLVHCPSLLDFREGGVAYVVRETTGADAADGQVSPMIVYWAHFEPAQTYRLHYTDSGGRKVDFATLTLDGLERLATLSPLMASGFMGGTCTVSGTATGELLFQADFLSDFEVNGASFMRMEGKFSDDFRVLSGHFCGTSGGGSHKVPFRSNEVAVKSATSTDVPETRSVDSVRRPITFGLSAPGWAEKLQPACASASASPMSAELLYSLANPNPSDMATRISNDLWSSAWSVYPDDRAQLLQVDKSKYKLPGCLKGNLTDDHKTLLEDMITAQVAPNMVAPSTMAAWGKDFDSVTKVRDRVQYFLQGSGKTCLSQNPHWNDIYTMLTDAAFADMTPGLKPYLDGVQKSSGEWAKDLYDYATQPDRLQQAGTGENAAETTQKVSILLKVLTKKANGASVKRLPKKYSNALAAMIYNLTQKMVDASALTPDEVTDMLADVLKALYERSSDESIVSSDKLQKVLKDMFKDGVIIGSAGISSAILELLKKFAKSFCDGQAQGSWPKVANMMKVFESWYEKLPEKDMKLFSKVAAVVPMLGFCCSTLVAIFGTFYWASDKKWNSLEPKWKAVAVSGTVYQWSAVVSNLGESYKEWEASVKKALLKSEVAAEQALFEADRLMAKACREWVDLQTLEDPDEVARGLERYLGKRRAAEAAEALAEDAAKIAEEKSLQVFRRPLVCIARLFGKERVVGKLARLAKPLSKALGAAASIVSTIVLGIEASEDIDAGKSGQAACDIIAVIAGSTEIFVMSVEFAAGLFSVTLEGALACVPVVGQVAAVVGLIVLLTKAILDSKHHDPVKEWVEEAARFLRTVKEPSEAWLEKHAIDWDKTGSRAFSSPPPHQQHRTEQDVQIEGAAMTPLCGNFFCVA